MLASGPVTIVIASPLEPQHAERIAAADPARTEVIYRPDLLPPARYVADHDGDPVWIRTAEQQAEWESLLARAGILWDFAQGFDGRHHHLSPDLRWIQATSAGVGQAVQRLGVRPGELVVTTASGVHAQPLAEIAIGALLYHTKRFTHLQAEQQAHRWEPFCAGELAGQTMAIIGPGRIGREVARLARAFTMRVVAMGRTSTPERAAELGVDAIYLREWLHERRPRT